MLSCLSNIAWRVVCQSWNILPHWSLAQNNLFWLVFFPAGILWNLGSLSMLYLWSMLGHQRMWQELRSTTLENSHKMLCSAVRLQELPLSNHLCYGHLLFMVVIASCLQHGACWWCKGIKHLTIPSRMESPVVTEHLLYCLNFIWMMLCYAKAFLCTV